MKRAYVVDTNVPIAANGTNKEVAFECRFRCVEFLEEFASSGILVVDLEGEVEAEYRNHLVGGQPGVGNRFFQRFFSEAADRVIRVSLLKDKRGQYKELAFDGPLKNFDRSDRKFAALAKIKGVPVKVAVDTDWVQHRDDLRKCGVVVEFLCGEDSGNWFIRK